jgi:hypothetical protein
VCQDPQVSDQEAGETATERERTPATTVTTSVPTRAGASQTSLASATIVAAVMCLLASGIIVALAADLGSGPDVWKARVRLMSVSAQGSYGGILITLGLLLALSLVRGPGRSGLRSLAVIGTVASGVWLAILMVLNVYVVATEITPTDIAFATGLGDFAALIMAVVAVVWGFSLAGARRPAQ